MEIDPSVQGNPKPVVQYVPCLNCGYQYPRVFAVCPSCIIKTRTKGEYLITSAGVLVLLSGIIWFIIGFALSVESTTSRNYYGSISFYNQIGVFILCLSGAVSFLIGLLLLGRKWTSIVIMMSFLPIVLGIHVNYYLSIPELFLPIMINIYVLLIAIIYRFEIGQERRMEDEVWKAPNVRGAPAHGDGSPDV